jgi:hypothetical protein
MTEYYLVWISSAGLDYKPNKGNTVRKCGRNPLETKRPQCWPEKIDTKENQDNAAEQLTSASAMGLPPPRLRCSKNRTEFGKFQIHRNGSRRSRERTPNLRQTR